MRYFFFEIYVGATYKNSCLFITRKRDLSVRMRATVFLTLSEFLSNLGYFDVPKCAPSICHIKHILSVASGFPRRGGSGIRIGISLLLNLN